MNKGWLQLLAAAALFIAVPFTLVLVENTLLKVLLLALIAASFILIYRNDQNRAVQQRMNELDAIDNRVMELLPQFENSPFQLEVRGASLPFLTLLCGVFGGILFAMWTEQRTWMFFLAGSFLLAMFMGLLIHEWKIANKPLFAISHQGLLYKEAVPWYEVENISLIEISSRGTYLYHQIIFTIPNLERFPSAIPRWIHFFSSLRKRPPTTLVFAIQPNGNHPEVVSRLCKMLWALDHRNNFHSNQFQH